MSQTYTNLPANINPQDSASKTKQFFDTYYTAGISVSSDAINAATGFFEARGFDASAASATAAVLLKQSKIEQVNVNQLLDTLKGLNDLQLSRVVTEILNQNRFKTSILGYKNATSAENDYEIRNIMA
jgi:hypothetical protein